MNEAPDAEREPAGYIRLPWPDVGGGLLLVLVALLGLGLFANRNLRPQTATAPTAVVVEPPTATSLPAVAATRVTTPTSEPAAIATATVPVATPAPAAATAAPAATPRP